ncbi:phosphate acyltransferase PlsX [Mycoplasmopsis lipofaciens]|uniref:phosphate acyltransferase PlsX n=1 Tax=Mycoplasmopsis lipofaciens TaxID=114884 RepID=UPI00048029DE|nr:phosphate acyltransferase PlsX [Mycoplasmopsis lipofaciens]
MFKIAFDIIGNDNGIEAALAASLSFIKENENYEIILVGPKTEIEQYYNSKKIEIPKRISIVDNSTNFTDVKNIRQSLHEKTSMMTAIDLVINNEAHAVLSSGDSGMYLAASTFKFKRLKNVSRAAFMPLMPTIVGRKFLLLDVGANLETKTEYLVEWAKIANSFAKVFLKTDTPRIALLNIGVEDYKGLEITRNADSILKQNKNINYIGFKETRDLLEGICDVAVIDGYGGNLVLKSYEGAVLSFKKLIKSQIMKKTIRKIGYLFLKNAFNDVSKIMDYRNVGAAWIAGVDGIAIKSHGSSDQKAYMGALEQIKIALENNILNQVKKDLEGENCQ